MSIEIGQIRVPPGSSLLVEGVDWRSFERFLDTTCEHRATRAAYDDGLLELMTPHLEHEDDKEIIGDLIKIMLEELDIEFRNAGSTTFRSEVISKGIEPDQCFYIKNEASIRGKRHINLPIDPPPDLALEIDITSRRQHTKIYAALGVPELWRFDGAVLDIHVLRDGGYIRTERSDHFPDFPIRDLIPRFVERSRTDGRNAAMRTFRALVRAKIDDLSQANPDDTNSKA